MRKPSFAMFVLGVLFAYASWMAFQDMLGLEGYIDAVRAHWVEMSPWPNAFIACLALAGALWPMDPEPSHFLPERPELHIGAWVRPRGAESVVRIVATRETEDGRFWEAAMSVIPPGTSLRLDDVVEIRTADGKRWVEHFPMEWSEDPS